MAGELPGDSNTLYTHLQQCIRKTETASTASENAKVTATIQVFFTEGEDNGEMEILYNAWG